MVFCVSAGSNSLILKLPESPDIWTKSMVHDNTTHKLWPEPVDPSREYTTGLSYHRSNMPSFKVRTKYIRAHVCYEVVAPFATLRSMLLTG